MLPSYQRVAFLGRVMYAKTMIKKLILLGFGLALLVGLPLAIFVMQNQTQPKSNAAPSTKFTFDVPSSPVQVGQQFDVPISVDPGGQNQVSFVKVTFTYDGNKLDKSATEPITIDGNKYTKLESPQISCTSDTNTCKGSFTISVGTNQDALIKSKTAIAMLHLIAKANTDPGTPTQLTFVKDQNQALSVAQADQAAENVFLAGDPASITIGSGVNGGGGGTPAPTPGNTGTPAPTGTGISGSSGSSSTGGTSGSTSVSCSSLSANPTSGNPPLAVTFTGVGTSSNDSITKITFNYGDGLVDQIASGSGIGTGSINAQQAHTYNTNGTYTATITLTTSSGAVSNPTACSQTIKVGQIAKNTGLPPTGPGKTILYVGVAGVVLTILGVSLVAGL